LLVLFVYIMVDTGTNMAATVDGHSAKVGSCESRRIHRRTGARSTDAVVGLTVSPPPTAARQSALLPPLSVRLRSAVSQGLLDTATELLDSGVISGPDKVSCVNVPSDFNC